MSNGFEMCDKHIYLFTTEGKDCPYCRIAKLEQELAGMKHVAETWKDKFVEHSRKLSRYAGAVEVEGIVYSNGREVHFWLPDGDKRNHMDHVKVLVMKEEVENNE